MVGLNNETKPMECSGSWDQVLQLFFLLFLLLLLLLLLLGNVVVPVDDQLGSGWVGHANNCDRIQTPFSIFNNKQVQTDMKAKLGDQFEAVKVTTFLFACKSHTYHASHT